MKKWNIFSLISNLLEKEVRRLVVRMETKCPEFMDLKTFCKYSFDDLGEIYILMF